MEGAPQAHTARTLIEFLECVHPGRVFEIDRQHEDDDYAVLTFWFTKITKQASMELEELERKGAKIVWQAGPRGERVAFAEVTLRLAAQ